MKKVIKLRGTGNTFELIKISALTKTPILCSRDRDIGHIKSLAHKHKMEIPEPIPAHRNLRGMRTDVLVDDAERVLSALLPNVNILAVSMSENTLEEIDHWKKFYNSEFKKVLLKDSDYTEVKGIIYFMGKELTCNGCSDELECEFGFDGYNTDGDCLDIK